MEFTHKKTSEIFCCEISEVFLFKPRNYAGINPNTIEIIAGITK